MTAALQPAPRTYEVRTYGCQMNVHDSERLSGLLEDAGYVRAADGPEGEADVVVFNTCAVRENADNRLYGNLGHLAPVKKAAARHADRRRRLPRAEGPRRDHPPGAVGRRRLRHPQHRVAARCCSSAPGTTTRRRSRSSSRSRSSPRRCRPGASRRTRPGSRSASAATTRARSASCRRCAAPRRTAGRATCSPRSRRWSPRASSRSRCSARTSTPTASSSATGSPSASCCAPAARSTGSSGCASPRPHPKDFTDDVIAAMAETPNVMHSLHMPLQSGSDAVLKAMRRSYRRERYLGIIDRVRAAMPDAAITTDIIVGFPGETDADFEQTLEVVAAGPVRRAPSPSSTPSGPGRRPRRCADQVPEGRRAGALRAAASPCRTTSSWAENKRPGRPRPSRCSSPRARAARTAPPHRLSGRARDNRLVHFAARRRRRAAPARRRRRGRGHLRRAAPPARATAVGWPTPHPCRRRVAPGRHAPAPAGRPARHAHRRCPGGRSAWRQLLVAPSPVDDGRDRATFHALNCVLAHQTPSNSAQGPNRSGAADNRSGPETTCRQGVRRRSADCRTADGPSPVEGHLRGLLPCPDGARSA